MQQVIPQLRKPTLKGKQESGAQRQAERKLPTKRNRAAGPRRHYEYSAISGNTKTILFLRTELQGMEVTL